MPANAKVSTRLPAKNLERARRFYCEKLGLEPTEERLGGVLYRCGGTFFAVFESAGSASDTAPAQANGTSSSCPGHQPHLLAWDDSCIDVHARHQEVQVWMLLD
jgi:catechol 2,3-dioxygenase-like lactoylglutathione lyase family enzyme